MILLPTSSTLFPYTTLFRSGGALLRRGERFPPGPPRRSMHAWVGGDAGVQRHSTPFRPHWTGLKGSDRKSTRLNSSHVKISYAVFCLKKKKKKQPIH